MDSKIGLIIQFFGIFLVATLFLFLANSLKSAALDYWKKAWLSLSLALLSLHFAFSFESYSAPFFIFYYLSEYVFAFYLIAGCRNYATGEKIKAKSWLLFAPGLLVAVFLTFRAVFADFNLFFNLHSFILAAAFAVGFVTLYRIGNTKCKYTGLCVMKFALLLLALDFLHYTVIFSLLQAGVHLPLPENYLAFNSIIDLVLEILLGFGMVIVSMERIHQKVEDANRKLKEAHDKLEKLAHTDPLTTAFTRHAFYNFLQRQGRENQEISGCVGVFDIDNLKPINDRFGHSVGDFAISASARAIRSLIRADDLIFRWGGDEFFVVMLGFDARQAETRMSEINFLLENLAPPTATEQISVRISYGFADFAEIAELEKAVEIADSEMYRAKLKNKQRLKEDKAPMPAVFQTTKNAVEFPAERF